MDKPRQPIDPFDVALARLIDDLTDGEPDPVVAEAMLAELCREIFSSLVDAMPSRSVH